MEALNVAQPLPINGWHASVHSDLRNPLGETDAPLICHICLSPYLIAIDKKLDELRKKLDELKKKNALEDLRKDLECIVCWDIPRRVPIFQCRRNSDLSFLVKTSQHSSYFIYTLIHEMPAQEYALRGFIMLR